MNIKIQELQKNQIKKYDVKNFLFRMIKTCYGIDYIPKYHYDIINLEHYYLNPTTSTFLIAIDTDKNTLIGTSAIRAYDKNYKLINKHYTKETTASIYRVFVEPKYRRCKIASQMIKKIENFCQIHGYQEIYLHTQEKSHGALPFWLNNNYEIILNSHDELGTIHMEKYLYSK